MGDVERVREVRRRLFADGTVTPHADGRPRDLFPVAIGLEEGLALRDTVSREGARRTIEVGLGFAVSALFILEGLLANGPDARHLAIDPYQHVSLPSHRTSYAGAGLDTLEAAGVRELVELHEQESQLVLPRLLAESRSFDFAFVDGSHRFEAVFVDLYYCARLLGEGRIVFVDDVQLPGPRRATAFCRANLGWIAEGEGEEGEHRWLVLRTGPTDAFSRSFEELADF